MEVLPGSKRAGRCGEQFIVGRVGYLLLMICVHDGKPSAGCGGEGVLAGGAEGIISAVLVTCIVVTVNTRGVGGSGI